ncbi:MAG TPA: hypothetical protein VJ044_16995, partial [Candidatus Hodarchaeales archaeon]|nr:hypothetical protein [Candidatus Hodarchaeales archaeon]
DIPAPPETSLLVSTKACQDSVTFLRFPSETRPASTMHNEAKTLKLFRYNHSGQNHLKVFKM